MCHLVFSATEQLSTTLQLKAITAEVSIQARDATMAYLQRQRCEDAFNIFYDFLFEEARDKTEEPKLPRHRRIPRRIDDGVSNYRHGTVKDYYRQQYFEVLDIIIREIEKQLNQTSLGILNDIEGVLLSASNGILKQVPKRIKELYSSIINFDKLVRQLSMFQDFIKASKATTQGIKTITKLATVCEIMNSSDLGNSLFTELHKLLTIYLTVPMTFATAERTFSSLRRLKN
uniref:HAT C-terminal dimerisation domain-containing protein n=1 Tax=Amphimedon queenslandica TaxID=400682 RepID=A0A1X7UNH8_AMPQE